MYQLAEEDINRKNWEFLFSSRFPSVEDIDWYDPWAKDHSLPFDAGYRYDPVAQARANFVNSWPSDGAELDVAGLESSIERARDGTGDPAIRPDVMRGARDEHMRRRKAIEDSRTDPVRVCDGEDICRNEALPGRRMCRDCTRRIDALNKRYNVRISPFVASYAVRADALGLPYHVQYDGVDTYIECHDAQVRPAEEARRWLTKETRHVGGDKPLKTEAAEHIAAGHVWNGTTHEWEKRHVGPSNS